jgi:hypothetical protein
VGHTLRFDSLFHLKASHVSVSQSSLKAGGGATVGDACGTIVEVTSGSS